MTKHFLVNQLKHETHTPANFVKKLYDLISKQELTGDEYDNTTNFDGEITLATPTYRQWVDKIHEYFPDLIINGEFYILFQDHVVEEIMAAYLLTKSVGDGIGITEENAKDRRINSLTSNLFMNNTNIQYFNELINFENITTIPSECFKGCTNLKEIDLTNITSLNSQYGQNFSGCSSLSKVIFGNIPSIPVLGFANCSLLETFENGENIINVGNQAFYQDSYLEYIDLQNCKSIGNYAFEKCTSLKNINLSNVETLSQQCFQNCSQLTFSGPLSKCTTIANHVFVGCTSLTSIDLPVCTSIGRNTFYNLQQLLSVNIPNVTNISDYLFENCLLLSSVTANPTTIGTGSFKQCKELTNINLSDCTSIGNEAFSGCNKLNLTNHNLTNVTSVGSRSFGGCSALTQIELPNCTSVGYGGFRENTSLTSIDLSNCTSLENTVFWGCTNLTNITGLETMIANNVPHGIFRSCQKLVFPETLSINAPYIGTQSFYDCKKLTKVSLGTNTTMLYTGAFESCNALTKVEGLEHIQKVSQYMFANCSNLEGVLNLSNVTGCTDSNNIEGIGQGGTGRMFYKCSKVTKIILGHIPNITLSRYTGDETPFCGCTALHTVDITTLDEINLTINPIFCGCPNMQNFVLRCSPPTINLLDHQPPLLWGRVFYESQNIGKIYVPDEYLNDYKTANLWSDIAEHIFPLSEYVEIQD